MPTHRVRHVDSSEWTIAAYVPGLELTTTVLPETAESDADKQTAKSPGIKKLVRGLRGKKKTGANADNPIDGKRTPNLEPPDIVALCDEIMEAAFERNASDLHIDPEENIVLVELRIDGELEMLRKLPKNLHGPILGRFKVLAKMDIAERRAPQDGNSSISWAPARRKPVFAQRAYRPQTAND